MRSLADCAAFQIKVRNTVRSPAKFVALQLALASIAGAAFAQSAETTANQPINVEALFAGTCGWCHSGGGRVPGKGPQLMNTARTDDYLRNRIKYGKEGAMPAFGQMLSDAQTDAILAYIHDLKAQ